MTQQRFISRQSLFTIRIVPYFNKIELGSATGFIYKHKEKYFLVSNWHVFAGRNVYDGQPLHNGGAIPNYLCLSMHKKKIGHFDQFEVDISDVSGVNPWLQHSVFGQTCDVAILEVEFPGEMEIEPHEANWENEINNIVLYAGSDVFILGYPNGLSLTGTFPIWKRGSVATEPNLDADNAPLILIDTASRPGMSGSPVFQRVVGAFTDLEGELRSTETPLMRLIGVYSGRYGVSDNFDIQLGRVWKRRVIDEIIESGVAGTFELRK